MSSDKLDRLVVLVQKTASKHNLFNSSTPLLLMVSGGCDSTSLTRIFAELQKAGDVGPLAALHVNHKLRPGDAEKDQAFVEALCQEHDIPLYIVETDVAKNAELTGENIEAAGRRERYTSAAEALHSLCEHFGCDYADGRIVTAHTLSDRVENFYMRSIVGTGPGGFRSMKYKNANVIRPLLDVTREELEEAMREVDQTWREDATNAHTDQFRAYVRHELVPVAKKRNGKLHQTLARAMNLIAEEDDMLEEMACELLSSYCEYDGTSAKITLEFGEQKLPLQRRAIFRLLDTMKPNDERVENASVEAVISAFRDRQPKNIQFDLAVSSNKTGVLIEPMSEYRARRKKK